MGDLSARNFGLFIAYALPGFLALWGVGYSVDAVRAWLVGTGSTGPTVGGAAYVVVASIAAGMTASVVRWAVLDTIHHATGITKPLLDESNLESRLKAFDYLVENHYRYYQFYGNSLVAMLFVYCAWRLRPSTPDVGRGIPELILCFLFIVFTAGSRDALRKYYTGGALLLGTVAQKEVHHDQRQASETSPVTCEQQEIADE